MSTGVPQPRQRCCSLVEGCSSESACDSALMSWMGVEMNTSRSHLIASAADRPVTRVRERQWKSGRFDSLSSAEAGSLCSSCSLFDAHCRLFPSFPSPSSARIPCLFGPCNSPRSSQPLLCSPLPMTRGNQRETDRLRAQARAAKNAGGAKVSAGEANKKKESDAEAMRKKQEKADAKKKEEEAAAAKSKAGGQIVKAKIDLS